MKNNQIFYICGTDNSEHCSLSIDFERDDIEVYEFLADLPCDMREF